MSDEERDVQTYRERYGWSALNKILVVLVIVLPYVFAGYLAYRTEVRNDDYRGLFSLYEELSQDCEDSTDCETNVPDPKTVEASQGKQGIQGEQGDPGRPPTTAEIQNAVQKYCAKNGCTGADGKTPTAADVAAAVSQYCADGKCQGPEGEAVVGPQGPPGESVTGPSGPAGPAGPAGKDGADGESAFPFSFRVVIDGTTYTCTVTSSTESTCVAEDPQTTPTPEPPNPESSSGTSQ